VKLWLLASWVSIGRPFGEVQAGHLLGQALEVAFGHIAAALFSLLVVEELDEVPGLVLLARGERRDLLVAERFGFACGRLERAVFDPQLARLDPLLNDAGERAQREVAADRALEVAEVLQRHGRSWAAEDVAALCRTGEQAADGRDFGLGLRARRSHDFAASPAARREQDHDDRDDDDCERSAELCEPFAPRSIADGRFLGGFSFSARLLTALLARQVLLVDPLAHERNFYTFLLKSV